jgi:hypothetical protein
VALNLTLAGAPTPDAAGSGAPNYALNVYLNLTNTGAMPLVLRGLHLPLRFSRAVQSWDGAWAAQSPASFNASCWGAYLTDPAALADPWRMRTAQPLKDMCRDGLTATVTDWGVDIALSSGILCPNCSLTGPPGGFPMLVVQHSSYGALDVGSAAAAPPACGQQPALQPLPLPGPERHPACAPWANAVRRARTRCICTHHATCLCTPSRRAAPRPDAARRARPRPRARRPPRWRRSRRASLTRTSTRQSRRLSPKCTRASCGCGPA